MASNDGFDLCRLFDHFMVFHVLNKKTIIHLEDEEEYQHAFFEHYIKPRNPPSTPLVLMAAILPPPPKEAGATTKAPLYTSQPTSSSEMYGGETSYRLILQCGLTGKGSKTYTLREDNNGDEISSEDELTLENAEAIVNDFLRKKLINRDHEDKALYWRGTAKKRDGTSTFTAATYTAICDRDLGEAWFTLEPGVRALGLAVAVEEQATSSTSRQRNRVYDPAGTDEEVRRISEMRRDLKVLINEAWEKENFSPTTQ